MRLQSLRARFQLPLGAIVHPLAGPQDDVPVIQLGPAGIVRCKRCRTYINPFMMWQDGGRCGAGLVLPVPAACLRPWAGLLSAAEHACRTDVACEHHSLTEHGSMVCLNL